MDLYEDEYVRAGVGSHLLALRESQFLTDITIHTASAPVVAHRIVLAAHSSFFRAVCSVHWGSQTGAVQTVALKHVPHDTMLVLIKSLYNGRLEIDDSNALSVLSLALELDVQLVRLGAIKVRNCWYHNWTQGSRLCISERVIAVNYKRTSHVCSNIE